MELHLKPETETAVNNFMAQSLFTTAKKVINEPTKVVAVCVSVQSEPMTLELRNEKGTTLGKIRIDTEDNFIDLG